MSLPLPGFSPGLQYETCLFSSELDLNSNQKGLVAVVVSMRMALLRAHILAYLGPRKGNCLGSIRRYDIVRRGMSQEVLHGYCHKI